MTSPPLELLVTDWLLPSPPSWPPNNTFPPRSHPAGRRAHGVVGVGSHRFRVLNRREVRCVQGEVDLSRLAITTRQRRRVLQRIGFYDLGRWCGRCRDRWSGLAHYRCCVGAIVGRRLVVAVTVVCRHPCVRSRQRSRCRQRVTGFVRVTITNHGHSRAVHLRRVQVQRECNRARRVVPSFEVRGIAQRRAVAPSVTAGLAVVVSVGLASAHHHLLARVVHVAGRVVVPSPLYDASHWYVPVTVSEVGSV